MVLVMALIQCSECNTQISEQAVVCPACGKPQLPLTEPSFKRPALGMIAGAILGALGLFFEIRMLVTNVSMLPVIATIPTLGPVFLINPIAHLLADIVLLVGLAKTVFNQRSGPRIVRLTCLVMIMLTITLSIFMLIAVS
jgi:hypothetical protein